SEITSSHLPLASQDLQYRPRIRRQQLRFPATSYSPERIEIRNQPASDEGGLPLHQLCIENAASAHDVIFDVPGKTALGMFLTVAGHKRVSPPANSDVK